MYILLIDGNFFLRRITSVANLTFIETPEKDREDLLERLSQSFAALIRKHEKYINNVIMVRDYGSWRKHVSVIKPLELLTEDSIDEDYKDNRKTDESIDWVKIYGAFDEFCETLNTVHNVPIIKVKNAEGDDNIFVISKMLNSINRNVLIWSSDGDMIQLVNDKTLLFRMPKEIVYIDKKTFEYRSDEFSIFEKTVDILDAVLSNGSGKHFSNAASTMLKKIVQGDAKDNVPPIFMWRTAKTKAKPNNTHINKALANMQHLLEDMTIAHLYDVNFIKTLLSQLMIVSKQTRDLEHTYNVFVSNRQLLLLNHIELPKDLQDSIIAETKKQLVAKTPELSKLVNYQNILNNVSKQKQTGFFSQFDLDA